MYKVTQLIGDCFLKDHKETGVRYGSIVVLKPQDQEFGGGISTNAGERHIHSH